jgi:hypothetical protein
MDKYINGFVMRKGRNLSLGEKVEVYFNLHKNVFSIKSIDKNNPDRGKVVAYSPVVLLNEVEFKVSEPIRLRINRLGRKEVCAVLRGTFNGSLTVDDITEEIYFNPYFTKHFTHVRSNQPVSKAKKVFCLEKRCLAHEIEFM